MRTGSLVIQMILFFNSPNIIYCELRVDISHMYCASGCLSCPANGMIVSGHDYVMSWHVISCHSSHFYGSKFASQCMIFPWCIVQCFCKNVMKGSFPNPLRHLKNVKFLKINCIVFIVYNSYNEYLQNLPVLTWRILNEQQIRQCWKKSNKSSFLVFFSNIIDVFGYSAASASNYTPTCNCVADPSQFLPGKSAMKRPQMGLHRL